MTSAKQLKLTCPYCLEDVSLTANSSCLAKAGSTLVLMPEEWVCRVEPLVLRTYSPH